MEYIDLISARLNRDIAGLLVEYLKERPRHFHKELLAKTTSIREEIESTRMDLTNCSYNQHDGFWDIIPELERV